MRRVDAESLWARAAAAESRFHALRWQFLEQTADPLPILRRALSTRHRGAALRTMLIMSEERVRDALPELIDAASHSDAELGYAREVLRRFDRAWLLAHIWPDVEAVVSQGDEETMIRMDELLSEVGPLLRSRLADLGRSHSNPDVRAFAETMTT